MDRHLRPKHGAVVPGCPAAAAVLLYGQIGYKEMEGGFLKGQGASLDLASEATGVAQDMAMLPCPYLL